MDHEFGSSVLEADQVGWDWFGLQFDDGRDLMLYQMRRRDGSRDPFSSGTLINRDGSIVRLTRDDYVLEPLDTWRSEATGTTLSHALARHDSQSAARVRSARGHAESGAAHAAFDERDVLGGRRRRHWRRRARTRIRGAHRLQRRPPQRGAAVKTWLIQRGWLPRPRPQAARLVDRLQKDRQLRTTRLERVRPREKASLDASGHGMFVLELPIGLIRQRGQTARRNTSRTDDTVSARLRNRTFTSSHRCL